ncbi:MAG TPA: hypothetical protein VMW36_01045 [Patescibacteria group bacterium]|nr:hypothetical protein [Patescibacteria group bacterium]
MSLSRILLRLLFLICGIFLIIVSPFFIFHPEKIYYPGPSLPPGYFWGYNTYYIMFGVFLLMVGLALIVASYYRHGETNLPMKI